jgi:hypothetical protein
MAGPVWFLETGGSDPRKVADTPPIAGYFSADGKSSGQGASVTSGIAISPDGRCLLYTHHEPLESNLVLLESVE